MIGAGSVRAEAPVLLFEEQVLMAWRVQALALGLVVWVEGSFFGV